MFWNRPRRAERHQKVLDELLELDPQLRRDRLDLAVASGDVRADEVDAALQIVSRLDRLRLMTVPAEGLRYTLPGSRRLVHRPEVHETAPEPHGDEAVPAESSSIEIQPEAGAASTDESSRFAPALAPIGAIEAAARLLAMSEASHGSRRSSRARRRRAMTTQERPTDESQAQSTGAAAAEHWPDISWLRP